MITLCCSDCFYYDSVKDYIRAHGIGRGYCHFCESESRHCIDPGALSALLYPLINLYDPVDEFMPMELLRDFDGDNIAYKLHWDWEPFTFDNLQKVEQILEAIFGRYDPVFGGGIDLESWVEDADRYFGSAFEPSEELKDQWNKFCKEILYRNRFFPNETINLDILHQIPILFETIKTDAEFFRSRKTNNNIKFPPAKMGPPPIELSQNGRANPKGIPYLYLATDLQTAVAELRPTPNDYITIGKFKVKSELEILDLSNPKIADPPILGNDLEYAVRVLDFLRMLGVELSKPINNEEKDLLYIPTQYLCEFIKNRGFDGVKYRSYCGSGMNIALFETTKVKCTRSCLYKIDMKPVKL